MAESNRDVARRLNHGLTQWSGGISGWFGFVNRRRIDARFSVFPQPVRLAEMLAVAGSLILFTVITADRLYMQALASAGPARDGLFDIITQLGKSNWILIATGAVVILLSLFTSHRFSGPARAVWHRVLLTAYYIFTTVAFSGLLTLLLKQVFARARPPMTPEDMIWFTSHFTDTYEFGSFPSGHSTTAGALAVALALLFPRGRVFLILLGIWIAISRPVLGVHFPSDALAGFLAGGAFSYFYARSFARKRLLFRFDGNGAVVPRGEGRGRLSAFAREARGMTAGMVRKGRSRFGGVDKGRDGEGESR